MHPIKKTILQPHNTMAVPKLKDFFRFDDEKPIVFRVTQNLLELFKGHGNDAWHTFGTRKIHDSIPTDRDFFLGFYLTREL